MTSSAAQPISASTGTKTAKRSARRRQPFAWLGAGALTVGVGVALAGAGVAHADDAAAPGDSATSVTASPTAGNSRGATVRTVGGRAATARTANKRGAAADTSGRSAALATVSRQVAATTVDSRSKFDVASTAAVPAGVKSTFADLWVAAAQVVALAGPGSGVGAPRVEKVFGPGAFKSADFGPLAPAMWALTEAAYQFQGLTPRAKPFQLQSAPGQTQVVGTLNTVAAFGAPVTFAVTNAPANGTVEIDAQGFYTYTPDAAIAASGGTDSFTVTATDTGLHFETLFGLSGHATTVVVPVAVAPQVLEGSQAVSDAPTVQNTYYAFNNSLASQTFGNIVSQQGMWVQYPRFGLQLSTGQQAAYIFNQYKSGEHYPDETQMQQQLISNGSVDSGVPGTLAWAYPPLRVADDIFHEWNNVPLHYFNVTCQPSAGACYAPDPVSTTVAGGGSGEDAIRGTIYMNDAPGTVYTVPASQAQQQSDILANLVFTDDNCNLCNAQFFPKSAPVIGYTKPLKVQDFAPYTNYTQDPSTNSYTVSQTTYSTNSTTYGTMESEGVKATLELVDYSAKSTESQFYKISQTNRETYAQSTSQTVRPNYTLFLYTQTPVQRFYGDWTVQYGNTTYILNDVWYDTPYPVSGQYPMYLTAYTCQVGSSDCAQLANGYVPATYPSLAPPDAPIYPVADTPPAANPAAGRISAMKFGSHAVL
jgi:hypothetical protein